MKPYGTKPISVMNDSHVRKGYYERHGKPRTETCGIQRAIRADKRRARALGKKEAKDILL